MAYTDGVTEARSPEGEFYGDDRLVTALATHRGSASTLADGLLEEVMEFQAGQPRDDIALVAVAVLNNPLRPNARPMTCAIGRRLLVARAAR